MSYGRGVRPPRVRVKICGITNSEDARAAVEAGADALGFNCFQGSKRHVDLASTGAWIALLPAHVKKIVVTVNPTAAEALALATLPFVDALQLHGAETPELCQELVAAGIRIEKALPATNPAAVASALQFGVRTIVLDSSAGGSFGGTGTVFPWQIAADFVATHPTLRVILAGGLDAKNVAEAIRIVRPFGVDVTTGVESRPGQKDHSLLRAFLEAARAA
ncbi:MAG: phosphoribosylanthranilate isomerase [Chthoniobacterales bacterium]